MKKAHIRQDATGLKELGEVLLYKQLHWDPIRMHQVTQMELKNNNQKVEHGDSVWAGVLDLTIIIPYLYSSHHLETPESNQLTDLYKL